MGVGTSLGAFYQDEFHFAASTWDPDKYDDNDMVVTPQQLKRNKELYDVEASSDNILGGIEVSNKNNMPFPDNRNPDSDFNSRFGNLPPSGILNDLKPKTNPGGPPLVRRISADLPVTARSPMTVGMDLELPPSAEILPEDATPKPTIMEKLFGLNGVERMKLWPERMLEDFQNAAGKVASGEVPMWAIDPKTGEMHTSLEAMEKAWEMMPGANSATLMKGAIGKAAKTDVRKNEPITLPERISESPRELQQLIAQARRLHEELNSADLQTNPRAVERGAPRQEFENPTDYALRLIGEALDAQGDTVSTVTPRGALETRPRTLDGEVMQEMAGRMRGWGSTSIEGLTEAFVSKALGNTKLKEGSVHLSKVQRNYQAPSSFHDFRFFHEETGTIGSLKISERNGGKQIYVEGIGLGDAINPNTMGRSATNDMLKALAKEFPEAETIAGWRISGGRGKAGKSGHAEMPLARFRNKNKNSDGGN